MKFKNPLLFFQVLTHLSIIPMVIYGHGAHYAIAFAVYFLTGCFGMSMTYHRLLSHRSWPAPRWFEIFGSVLGTLGLTGSTVAWCAVHREHHIHTDIEKDPHSPVHQSVWRVQYLSHTHRPRIRYMKDLLKDPLHVFLHRSYLSVNIAYAAILAVVDPFAVIYAYLFPACLLWNAGSLVNTLGHLVGYKNFPTKDESRNNIFLGFLTWGEGWHNNHHRYPKSAYFGRRWFEFDISGLFIRLIRSKKHGI